MQFQAGEQLFDSGETRQFQAGDSLLLEVTGSGGGDPPAGGGARNLLLLGCG